MTIQGTREKILNCEPTLLAVVHVADLVQAKRNVEIALENYADGVFLIEHSQLEAGWMDLAIIFRRLRKIYPDYWLGINFLDLVPRAAINIIRSERQHGFDARVDGLWMDNPGLDERSVQRNLVPTRNLTVEMKLLCFGGVAFKYKPQPDDLRAFTQMASNYMDVVTTSGPGTGKAADVEKIRTMKAAIGDKPLAIASGITADNVYDYLPHATCFLVATGISKEGSFTELDPEKVRALAEKLESYWETGQAGVSSA